MHVLGDDDDDDDATIRVGSALGGIPEDVHETRVRVHRADRWNASSAESLTLASSGGSSRDVSRDITPQSPQAPPPPPPQSPPPVRVLSNPFKNDGPMSVYTVFETAFNAVKKHGGHTITATTNKNTATASTKKRRRSLWHHQPNGTTMAMNTSTTTAAAAAAATTAAAYSTATTKTGEDGASMLTTETSSSKKPARLRKKPKQPGQGVCRVQ